ncbi:hypothetical protein BMS3Abin03_02160 [bacterium BMS3Abin03]|nr:hypothetical protein BMS3Abin03_02160 [bacterium BMS3Abin03]
MLLPWSDAIVLFFVFGSGLIYAYSPLKLKVDISLVEIKKSRNFVRKGNSADVLKSVPKIVLLNGSSPILTLSLKVC